jgi:hypothetical protein
MKCEYLPDFQKQQEDTVMMLDSIKTMASQRKMEKKETTILIQATKRL